MSLDFTAVDDLVTALRASGIRSVSTDPAKVNLPGVWVQVVGVGRDVLCADLTIRTRLALIVADTDPRRAMDALAALYNQVTGVLDATEATSATVTLPSDAKSPLPALLIPFELLT